MKLCAWLALASLTASAAIVKDVRTAIAANDFATGAQLIKAYRMTNGVTPEMLEALSWMARGELAVRNYGQAEKYASETYQLCTAELKKRPLDQERGLPIALGAAIEVEANYLAAQHRRAEAVTYLQDQLKLFRATSINARIQKNINLLTMEGKPAPALQKVALPKGKPVLLFFWAHWCGDCKAEGPILAQLQSEFKGLAIVAPTQKYGYVQGGEEAAPEVELRYIDKIRKERYADIIADPAPVSEVNFLRYGVSTTPTLVLVDRNGIVRLYHPGRMTYEELRPLVAALFKSNAS
ncbi:MAG: TlpA family protein disulfide reductase [Acidobacteriia bacterium]|nr:TlpA family protein disulfide reductase [Terriglobia bacterium]